MGQVRIVIATSALGMGVNFPDIRYVVHIGPSRSLIDHIQEAGRAGRDGKQAHNIILYHGNQLAHCQKPVKEFVRASGCIRKAIFKEFAVVTSVVPNYDCCNICEQECLCSGTTCNREAFQFEEPKGKSLEPHVNCQRSESDHDRQTLKDALCEIKDRLDTKSPFVFNSNSGHGFTTELVEELVKGAAAIFSLSDILKHFPVSTLAMRNLF